MADSLSRRLFMQLLGLAGAAAAIPGALASPTPEAAVPVEEVITPCARAAERVFEIFVKEGDGKGRWRAVGELQRIEVSLNPVAFETGGGQRRVLRGREETTFKIEAFVADEELDAHFAGAEAFKARVTVEGTTFHMPQVQIVRNMVTLDHNQPVRFTYEGIGFGHVRIEEAECQVQ
jgi:hypothetical protein